MIVNDFGHTQIRAKTFRGRILSSTLQLPILFIKKMLGKKRHLGMLHEKVLMYL